MGIRVALTWVLALVTIVAAPSSLVAACGGEVRLPSNPRPDAAAIVFLPGFLGSRLEVFGAEIWGTYSAAKKHFARLEYREDAQAPAVCASGIVEEFQMFGALDIDVYDDLISDLERSAAEVGSPLVLFPYDWRQSTRVSAQQLRDFVYGHGALGTRPLILVGHSMGGIVGSLFSRQFDDSHRVAALVTIGTPYKGSLNAVTALLGDTQDYAAAFGVTDDEFRHVLGSMPALLELFPTYDDCCFQAGRDEQVRPLDPEFWGLLPALQSLRQKLGPDVIDRRLAEAARIHAIVGDAAPPAKIYWKFAGNGVRTDDQIILVRSDVPRNCGKDQRRAGNLCYTQTFFGDGTVLLISATSGVSMKEIEQVAYADHLGLVNDIGILNELERLIKTPDKPQRVALSTRPLLVATKSGSLVEVDGIDIGSGEQYLRAGGETSVPIRLLARPFDEAPLDAMLNVALDTDHGTFPLQALAAGLDEEGHALYNVRLPSLTSPGPVRLRVDLGRASFTKLFGVIGG